MKKLISLFLLLAMVLSLCACAGDSEQTTAATTQAPTGTQPEEPQILDKFPDQFRVGYARELITPKQGLPMAGYGNTSTRIMETVMDDIYVTCTAITDEENSTVLIYSIDLCQVYSPIQVYLSVASEATGVPLENITMTATHTHSAVDVSSTYDGVAQYVEYVGQQIVAAGCNALSDRQVVTQVCVGDVETEGLNFIRHYELEDGTYAGDSFGDFTRAAIKCHTAEPDRTMHLVQFKRNGGKDVVMVNWRSHATLTGYSGGSPAKNLSSDFVGPFREAIEEMAQCHVIYLQGGAGNINPGSRVSGEAAYVDYREHGYRLAQYAYEGLTGNMTQVQTGAIQTQRTILAGKVNHSTDDLYIKAKEIATVWSTTNDRDLVLEMGEPYGIRSPYQANAISNRYKLGESIDLQLNAITIGDYIGIVTAPNEIFDVNTMYVEENSPYQMTFCMGYTNDSKGYMPAAYVWEYTSYETDTSYFEPGTAEIIADTMLEMLGQLNNG